MENQKTLLCTVSDDRFGRKEGLYQATQKNILNLFQFNPHFGIKDFLMLTWDDISKTKFYEDNKTLLDNADAARNGRVYKPYTIKTALDSLNEGDFLIYTDCSPEMWKISPDFYLGPELNLKVLKTLCTQNNGILSYFVKWDTRNIGAGELGIHTHDNFTTHRCIDKMGLQQHSANFMHASGMIVLQKSQRTVDFVNEWLYWNCIDECACLGRANVPGDYSFWDFKEEFTKMGHRHDQSISGLLINKMGNNLIDIVHNTSFQTYNFLNLCLPNYKYSFIDPNTIINGPRRLKKGDKVKNQQDQELFIFEFRPSHGTEWILVGPHRESCYLTTKDKLTLINN